MIVVYVAGPFRAPTAWEVEQNVRRAEELGLDVAKLGCTPLIPHTLYRYFHGQLTEEFWIDATAELVRRCDAMILVPGWERSAGTGAEINLAHSLGMPVCMTLLELQRVLITPPTESQ